MSSKTAVQQEPARQLPSSTAVQQEPVRKLLLAAGRAMADAGSYQVDGSMPYFSTSPVTILVNHASTSLSFRDHGRLNTYMSLPTADYQKASSEHWGVYDLPPKELARVSDVWVKLLPKQGLPQGLMGGQVGMKADIYMVTRYPQDAGIAGTKTAVFNGKPVTVVTLTDGTQLDISALGAPLLVHATFGRTGPQLTYSRYGSVPPIEPPADAYTLPR